MTLHKFNLPDVGEGLTEAEIVAWKVKPGDTVAINDVLCEIETAKSLVELPSPFAGTVTELLVPEGLTVDVGTPIISVSDAAPAVDAPAARPPPSRPCRPARRPCTGSWRRTRPTPANRPGARPAVRWSVPVPRPTPSSAAGGLPRRPRSRRPRTAPVVLAGSDCRARGGARHLDQPGGRRPRGTAAPRRTASTSAPPSAAPSAASSAGSWPSRRCARSPGTSASTCPTSSPPAPAAK